MQRFHLVLAAMLLGLWLPVQAAAQTHDEPEAADDAEALVIDADADGVIGEGDLVIVEADAVHAEAAEHAEDEHGGMPQLEASTFPSQILWLILSFGLLYWLLRTRGLPRVAEILEGRQERIDGNLDRAARLREEAEEAHARYEKVVADARSRASDQVKAVRDKANTEAAERTKELDQRLNARIEEAEARVARSREAALKEVDGVATEVAGAILQRLLGSAPPEDQIRAAVERVKGEAA